MTQSTPPVLPEVSIEYGRQPAPNRTNAFAIASLISGLVGCVPFITSLLAIAFGVVGMRRARNSSVGGFGLAVAGLVLGIVGVLGWIAFSGLLGIGYVQSKPAAAVAKQFLQDVSAGNTNAALNNSTGFTAAQLQSQSAQLNAFGALQSVSISSFNYSAMNGQTAMHLGGTATFANTTKTCTFDLVKTNGVYRVTAYLVQ